MHIEEFLQTCELIGSGDVKRRLSRCVLNIRLSVECQQDLGIFDAAKARREVQRRCPSAGLHILRMIDVDIGAATNKKLYNLAVIFAYKWQSMTTMKKPGHHCHNFLSVFESRQNRFSLSLVDLKNSFD